jgi:glycosyltransferase involved in cell wall biosynthesis
LARRYYRWTERVAARWATRLVTDARAMQDYYRSNYHVDSTFIPYGSQVGDPPTTTALDAFGLQPGGYYLVVTRIEPDNNTDLIVREYRRSGIRRPLVVVGSAAYPSDFSRALEREHDDHVRLVGAVYDSGALNGLYANAYAYLHGHEVGGTNPSLLRAMNGARPCVCLDIVYHREVLGEAGLFFDRAPGSLASILRELEASSDRADRAGALAAARAAARYRWDAVASAYAALFREMHRLKRGEITGFAPESYRPGDFAPGSDSSTAND